MVYASVVYDASVTCSSLWLVGGGQDRMGWDGIGQMDAPRTAVAFAKSKQSGEDVTEREGIWVTKGFVTRLL